MSFSWIRMIPLKKCWTFKIQAWRVWQRWLKTTTIKKMMSTSTQLQMKIDHLKLSKGRELRVSQYPKAVLNSLCNTRANYSTAWEVTHSCKQGKLRILMVKTLTLRCLWRPAGVLSVPYQSKRWKKWTRNWEAIWSSWKIKISRIYIRSWKFIMSKRGNSNASWIRLW